MIEIGYKLSLTLITIAVIAMGDIWMVTWQEIAPAPIAGCSRTMQEIRL